MKIAAGPSAGYYANRDGEYEVQPDGTVWLIGGSALPEGIERVLIERLPPDAAMTEAAMGRPALGGTTPSDRIPVRFTASGISQGAKVEGFAISSTVSAVFSGCTPSGQEEARGSRGAK